MDRIISYLKTYIDWKSLPDIAPTDVLEIIILAYFVYHVINYIKKTRAWVLVKGLILIAVIWLIATILDLNVLKYIITNTLNVGILAVIIVFQPEFRKALEQLGQKNIVKSISFFDDPKGDDDHLSARDINEIIEAAFELSKTKTGALVVIQRDTPLDEYESTGIVIDAKISSQLMINMFEHNTPLHDGAAIIKGNRITAATCYLPLSDNNKLSKDLGTRHRAGVGVSEVTDALVLIVSEETGKVSIAMNGQLVRNIDEDYLKTKLVDLADQSEDTRKIKLWKGRVKDER